MKENILVVAAHPDDEVLGCGATMALHSARGERVHVLLVGEGITSRGTAGSQNHRLSLKRLNDSSKRANRILGTASLTLAGLPDNRLDSVDLLTVVQLIEKAIRDLRPTVVYTHHGGDLNIDHQIVHRAVLTACRPTPGHPVKSLLFFEVPSSTEWNYSPAVPAFSPKMFVNVSKSISKKLAALRAYGSEMRPWPHARSLKAIEHLARWRGSNVGVPAAEAFEVGRLTTDLAGTKK
jgi:LmbE family N-acetylglucosaminyl deacetylase